MNLCKTIFHVQGPAGGVKGMKGEQGEPGKRVSIMVTNTLPNVLKLCR